MRRFGMLLLAIAVLGWALPYNVDPIDAPNVTGVSANPGAPAWDRVNIDSVGNIRSLLGSQGKSIAVSNGGEAIAVFYGAKTGNQNNPMIAKVAYSLNGGATWTKYGPFSGNARRMYNDVAGTPNFHVNPGELWFCFQTTTLGYTDCQMQIMIEENLPSSPSFSVPIVPPNAAAPNTYPWEPSVVVLPDNPATVVATGWDYLSAGDGYAYAWISTDGGYTYSDTINMGFIPTNGACGALAAGTGGYLIYAYLDTVGYSGTTPIWGPYYIESTDGGYNWSTRTPITGMPWNAASLYWWHEFDAIVVNDEPWVIFNDIGTGGTGGPHVGKASGSPGSWTWSIWNMDVYGADSHWVADTLYYCAPSQYPNLSYDPVSGMVLASSKYNIYIGDNVTWATHNGAHLGGMWTLNNGSTWTIAQPLSTAQTGTIVWGDWTGEATADHMVNSAGHVRHYSLWQHEDQATEEGILYFESEVIGTWPGGIQETSNNLVSLYRFSVTPTVASNICRASFTMPAAGNVALKVFDVSGRLVQHVFSGQAAGAQEININTSQLSNGAYFVVLETEQGNVAQKVITMR
ncbi:T9SS type A sorting domain-containing protein [candidate division WOR-3 bacterium]|nr:T9SS type A sorting domain-containing protein [candidate division WOR-3 bacterium]